MNNITIATKEDDDTIEFDISRDALFVMKDETGNLIATILIDEALSFT